MINNMNEERNEGNWDDQNIMANSEETRHHVILRKVSECIFGISLEPIFFCIIFTSVMYQLIAQNLYLEKACRVNIGYDSSICNALTTRNSSGYTKYQEANVQKLVTQMIGLRTAIQSFFPVCLVLFLGSWSDRHKRRKPLIMFPIIGEILCCVSLIINVIFFYELPLFFTVLGDSLPLALLGGWPSLFIGSYSYVGERCNNSNRTLKMGTLAAARMVGHSLGSSLGGILFSAVGFLGSLFFCIFCLLVALTSSTILVREENIQKKNNRSNAFFQDLFNITYFQSSVKTCFKKEPNSRRTKVVIYMLLHAIISGTMHAEDSVNYMFTRFSFGWNTVQYGLFKAIKFSVELLGSFIGLIIATKVFRWDEALMAVFGIVGSMVANSRYATAHSSRHFYSGIICDFFTILPYIAVRSLITKTIPAHELGQSNSVFGISDAITPLVFGPLYTTIYKYTIDVFPGTYFVVTIFLKSICFCFFIFLYYLSRQESKAKDKNSNNESHS